MTFSSERMHDAAFFNAIKSKPLINPELALRRLRELERVVAQSDLDMRVRTLRTHGLKRDRERRQAALFCYGQSQLLGHPIYFYDFEGSDFDFVATWSCDSTQHFAPVQLKEVVPERLSKNSSLQSVIDGLTKYATSDTLTVAIFFNRNGRLDLGEINVASLRLSALWIAGAVSPDQNRWSMTGNLLGDPGFSLFDYPQ